MDTCATCKYFKAGAEGSNTNPGYGDCKEHAPDMVRPGTFIGLFPMVHKDDWCGEFEVAPAPPPPPPPGTLSVR